MQRMIPSAMPFTHMFCLSPTLYASGGLLGHSAMHAERDPPGHPGGGGGDGGDGGGGGGLGDGLGPIFAFVASCLIWKSNHTPATGARGSPCSQH